MSSTLALLVLASASCSEEETSDVAPTQTAAERLCAAITSQLEVCGAPTPCDEALVADCADVVGVFSDPFLNAATSCLEAGGDIGSCFATSIEGLETTAAHRAFAEQFCSNCALGVPGCVETLFEGQGETQAVGQLLAPLSDGLVAELGETCATGLGCAATFSSCAQGVLVKRGMPEKTVSCIITKLTGADAAADCPAGTGTGGSGGSGGSPPTSSSTGGTGGSGGGELNCVDDNESNDLMSTATLVDAADDGKLSECEPAQTSVAALAGSQDDDWYIYQGLDGICGFDAIQPHAYAESAVPLTVCVYVKPNGGEVVPTCLEGSAATLGGGYNGCCGSGGARAAFGTNLVNDDAMVLMHVSSPTAPETCVDYDLTYRFGA
jgi:hypothetical protein